MKRFGFVLVRILFLLSMACGGGVPKTTPPNDSSTPLKENQFRGLLVKGDGKTGDLTFEVDGKEKTYPRSADFKAYNYVTPSIPATPFFYGDFGMHDMLVTLEKKDGKEYVLEMRIEKSKQSTKGTKVDGKFRGADYNKPIPDLILEVNGAEKKYPMAKRTRFFVQSGYPVLEDTTRAFLNKDVTIILDKEDGVDRVIEVWAK